VDEGPADEPGFTDASLGGRSKSRVSSDDPPHPTETRTTTMTAARRTT
jgi:hypothetical protein